MYIVESILYESVDFHALSANRKEIPDVPIGEKTQDAFLRNSLIGDIHGGDVQRT